MQLHNRYFLLRHGQTIYQKENRGMNYDPDSPQKLEITEEGADMVKVSAQSLEEMCKQQNFSIDVMFVSPYLRTKQSAKIAADILGVENVKYDNRLVDINLGEFLGKSMADSTAFYSKGNNLFDNRPKGGESWNDILKRLESFIKDIEKKCKDKNILVVSHADPIWLLAGYLKGYKTEEEFMEARKDREHCYPRVGQLIKV
jgi:broad specificity phosphatase PhoE